MNTYQKIFFLFLLPTLFFAACSGDQNAENDQKQRIVLKGLYSFGPEVKSFTDCSVDGREFWVVDSAMNLELEYSKLGFEKPYTPVYIEVECNLIKSDTTITKEYDSTMVVKKLIKITKQIPDGPCNQ